MEGRDSILDLKEIVETIKKRIVLILSITLIAVLGSGIVNYFLITPIYETKTEILVNKENNANSINNIDIQTNVNLINTYNVIIKSPRILDLVGDQMGLSEGQKAGLSGKIKVDSVKNSQVISVTVDDSSQARAVLIANTLAEIFCQQIPTIMNINSSNANAKILTPAKENPNAAPIKPNKTFNVAVAFVVGLLVGVGLAMILEYLDNTIKTERDIEKVLELPILGAVPRIQESKSKKKSRKLRPYEKVAATRERRA